MAVSKEIAAQLIAKFPHLAEWAHLAVAGDLIITKDRVPVVKGGALLGFEEKVISRHRKYQFPDMRGTVSLDEPEAPPPTPPPPPAPLAPTHAPAKASKKAVDDTE